MTPVLKPDVGLALGFGDYRDHLAGNEGKLVVCKAGERRRGQLNRDVTSSLMPRPGKAYLSHNTGFSEADATISVHPSGSASASPCATSVL